MAQSLASLLALLTGGANNIETQTAVPQLLAAQTALAAEEPAPAKLLAAQLGKLAELLNANLLTEANASLPPIAAQVEQYAHTLPEEQRPPLMAVAEQLHLADGGLDA
ncbi:hypothetical protein ACFFLM_20735 [Deinococcus oregonensis]|uniref:Uncharacterized protein n=1 Tax=Deinococcus oregonensis TaxID=1805970 RepID=A0ABV6B3Q8_9DEIO